MSITLTTWKDHNTAACVFPGALEPYIVVVKGNSTDSWQSAYDKLVSQINARGFNVPELVISLRRDEQDWNTRDYESNVEGKRP